jgi:thymidylate synthase ThyX
MLPAIATRFNPMRVQLVSLCPTDAARHAGRVALTPELLAATGARYSRNNEGLDAILARIDPERLDESVDSIFRMLDYGHQSIADMAPLAIFIDGVSAWLAYLVWSLAPQAGGQESSTRYIRLAPEGLATPDTIGLATGDHEAWRQAMQAAFGHYQALERGWQALAEAAPGRLRIPAALLNDESPKAQRQVARMRRNFAFDRARYLLPAAALTNLMLVMSARAWAALCQQLDASPLPEARALAAAIRGELALGAPRLLRHAVATEAARRGQADAFDACAATARRGLPQPLARETGAADHPDTASLDVLPPPGVDAAAFAAALRHHDNRYAWIGDPLRRTAVRFAWEAVAFAEIRDLNRHRTGSKYCPPVPMGFYAAVDQLPGADAADRAQAPVAALDAAVAFGCGLARRAHERLAAGDPTYVYWTLLGTQFPFEHVTTADKFIYEAELRTGAGAHFRYARHLHDALALWFGRFPETRPFVLEGAAEPE